MSTPTVTAEVTDCVDSHIAWMTAQAALSELGTWYDGPLHWASSADGRSVHGMFPAETPPDVVARGVERADRHGCVEVSIWSGVDVQRPELEALGFQVGWQPRWMVAPTGRFDAGAALLSRRATLSVRVREHERHLQPLLARGDVVRAEAHAGPYYAGRAWLHAPGEVAGLYDMAIWKKFRRAGYGCDLLALLGATARERGADQVTLNATPDGEELYSRCGFSRVGVGRTWWRILRDHRSGRPS